jgi:hypothetical protein
MKVTIDVNEVPIFNSIFTTQLKTIVKNTCFTSKISGIKEIRLLTGLGIREAKCLWESIHLYLKRMGELGFSKYDDTGINYLERFDNSKFLCYMYEVKREIKAFPNLRRGQVMYNVLFKMHRELAERVNYTELDPYYKQDKDLRLFICWVKDNIK